MKLSANGLVKLAEFEGVKLNAYQCSAGVWTIGIGSTYYANGTKVKQGDKLASRNEAYILAVTTMKQYIDAVNTSIKVPINQNQFDALVCFCYNIGAPRFKTSTVVKRINLYALRDKVTDAFLMWTKANGKEVEGLVNRRNKELALYFS